MLKKKFKVPRHGYLVSLALFALRVTMGVAFMHHGWMMIQSPFSWMGPTASMPGFLQALAAFSEYAGGFAMIIGLLVPLASFGLTCTMGVAVFTHAIVRGDPFIANGGKGTSYELALVYLCIAVLIAACGPGKLSLDKMIFGER